MKKRVLSLLLALAMCLSLSVPAWALETSATSIGDDFLEFYANTSIDYLISESDWAVIKKDFSDELNYVSATQGLRTNTSNISKAIMSAINKAFMENADNPDYNFSALTETIADMAFENALEQFNNSRTRAHPGQTEMRNIVRTTVVSYDALKGVYIDVIECGDSITYTGTKSFTLSVGTKIKTVTISIGESFSCSYAMNAHPLGTLVGNSGYEATHTAYFGILFGRVERYSYDLYDSYTGDFIESYVNYLVRDGDFDDYKFAVSQGSPTYMKHANSSSFTKFDTINEYRTKVASEPYKYF